MVPRKVMSSHWCSSHASLVLREEIESDHQNDGQDGGRLELEKEKCLLHKKSLPPTSNTTINKFQSRAGNRSKLEEQESSDASYQHSFNSIFGY